MSGLFAALNCSMLKNEKMRIVESTSHGQDLTSYYGKENKNTTFCPTWPFHAVAGLGRNEEEA